MTNKRKETKELLAEAEAAGWTPKKTKMGWLLRHPSGATYMIHRSGGSCPRGRANTRAALRRAAG